MKTYSSLKQTLKEEKEVFSYNIFIPVFYVEEWVDSGWQVDIDPGGRISILYMSRSVPETQRFEFKQVIDSYRNLIPEEGDYEDSDEYERALEEFIEQIESELSELEPQKEWGLPDDSIVVKEIASDFNESHLEKYLDRDLKNVVISLEIVGYTKDKYGLVCQATTTRPLVDEELKKLLDYIVGQCSDGWGEGFEQRPVRGYYISTWDLHATKYRGDRSHRIMKPNESYIEI